MNMKEKLKTFLENHPEARERRFREKWLVDFILEHKKYPFPLTKKNLADFVHNFASADRYWRMILEENHELRGIDYKDGEKLSDEWQIKNEFQPMHDSISKKIRQIVEIEDRNGERVAVIKQVEV